jgi:hypothetical protein
MGGLGDCYAYRNESPRIAAWEAHYAAKGCSDTKAAAVARRRVSRKGGWPPCPR